MPGRFDGQEVIRESRRVNPGVPVLSLSSYDYKPEGVNANIKKHESDVEEVLRIIAEYLRK